MHIEHHRGSKHLFKNHQNNTLLYFYKLLVLCGSIDGSIETCGSFQELKFVIGGGVVSKVGTKKYILSVVVVVVVCLSVCLNV